MMDMTEERIPTRLYIPAICNMQGGAQRYFSLAEIAGPITKVAHQGQSGCQVAVFDGFIGQTNTWTRCNGGTVV